MPTSCRSFKHKLKFAYLKSTWRDRIAAFTATWSLWSFLAIPADTWHHVVTYVSQFSISLISWDSNWTWWIKIKNIEINKIQFSFKKCCKTQELSVVGCWSMRWQSRINPMSPRLPQSSCQVANKPILDSYGAPDYISSLTFWCFGVNFRPCMYIPVWTGNL